MARADFFVTIPFTLGTKYKDASNKAGNRTVAISGVYF